MGTLPRILTFGSLSGLTWSVVPGILDERFSNRADLPAVLIAGLVSGIATSIALGAVVARTGRWLTVVLGLLSLPFGAFVFGFSLALLGKFLPALTSGSRGFPEPWNLGFTYALLSVVSVFAMGLFPLAVASTFLLKRFVLHGSKAPRDDGLASSTT